MYKVIVTNLKEKVFINLMEMFTEREKEVLQLLITGLNNKQISAKLFISNHTTKAHITSIYKKLNVSNRVQATIKCIKMGMSIDA